MRIGIIIVVAIVIIVIIILVIMIISIIIIIIIILREAPPKLSPGSNGHCQNGEGGLNACQDGLGHLFRDFQMGNLLDCMVWGTYAVKIEVQMGNCLIVEGSNMLASMVWGTYNDQHGNLTKLLNSVRK